MQTRTDPIPQQELTSSMAMTNVGGACPCACGRPSRVVSALPMSSAQSSVRLARSDKLASLIPSGILPHYTFRSACPRPELGAFLGDAGPGRTKPGAGVAAFPLREAAPLSRMKTRVCVSVSIFYICALLWFVHLCIPFTNWMQFQHVGAKRPKHKTSCERSWRKLSTSCDGVLRSPPDCHVDDLSQKNKRSVPPVSQHRACAHEFLPNFPRFVAEH